jgi:hypothetical protein
MPDAEKQGAAKSRRTAEKWGRLFWSTHRSINRNLGKWTDSKGRNHKWNDEL